MGDSLTNASSSASNSSIQQQPKENISQPSVASVSVAMSEEASTNNASIAEGTDETLQVVPLAGFVLKTRRISTNQKVFVNIFYHGIVGSLLSTPAKQQVDKKGESCSVYDIIMPEAHYLDCVADEIIRDQVSPSVSQSVSQSVRAFYLYFSIMYQ